MTNEMLVKIQNLMESEAFGEEIKDVETAEELKSTFEKYDIDITVEEVEAICLGIASKSSSYLNENDLDQVTGGAAFLTVCAVAAGTWAVCYGVGYVAGKVANNKSGVCFW